MRFRSYVEPAEPMRGLQVPPAVVEALGGGKRPAVTITINGHSWKSRVAIMRGRYLLGLSNANRQAVGVVTGNEVEVEVEIDAEPRVVAEPADFARALDADPVARAAYDRLSYSRKWEHALAIESTKKTQTRTRLIEKALAMLRDQEPPAGRAARAKTRSDHPSRLRKQDHACHGAKPTLHMGRCAGHWGVSVTGLLSGHRPDPPWSAILRANLPNGAAPRLCIRGAQHPGLSGIVVVMGDRAGCFPARLRLACCLAGSGRSG